MISGLLFAILSSDNDRLSQLIVDAVSCVFDGDHAAASAAGDHGDGLAAVAAQREEERVEFFVVGQDLLNDVFFTFFGVS